LMPA
jgi:excisionase family DNA binding protein